MALIFIEDSIFIVQKMLDFIEHVVYINLDSRRDRRIEVLSELKQVFPDEKIQRFSAIRHDNGAVGCSKSHIAVIEMAKKEGWGNVLIIEDDFMWQNMDNGIPDLERYASIPYDVVLLSGTFVESEPISNRVISSQTTVAYIVSAHYYDTLLENYKAGVNQLETGGIKPVCALDMYWKRLQRAHNWFIVQPKVCLQRPSYSDIENKYIDYRCWF